ncbi:unnamed protein product, partial [Adineta steineri]
QCHVGFKLQEIYSTGDNSFPIFVSLTDINDDNRSDIIVANQNTHSIGVFFNIQGNYFRERITYSTGLSYPRYISVVDVNDDDKPDIIVANSGGHNVGVILNKGPDQFDPIKLYGTGHETYPHGVAVADVNGDKKPDIIVTNGYTNTIGVFSKRWSW